MGRGSKSVVAGNGLDRRVIGHYETPARVAEFMAAEMLRLNPNGKKALDPCVGTGTLLQPFRAAGVATSGMDIVDWRNKPMDNFVEEDFLHAFYESSGLWSTDRFSEFDFFVLNPPYNCHESDYVRSNKPWLSSAFLDVGIANMYAMFVSAAIRSAKPGAVLGILALDSFMTARLHEPLRNQILESCIIHTIALCPRDLFRSQNADVRTCVMILEKISGQVGPRPPVATLDRTANAEAFFARLQQPLDTVSFDTIALCDKRDRTELVVGAPPEIVELFQEPRLGEVFSCITGISTGADSKYLRSKPESGFSVPFYKNPASRRFWMEPDAYLIDHYVEESRAVSNFMVRNRSAYAKPGLSCSSMGLPFGATFRPGGTTFGVNPNVVCSDEDIWWVLGYLNSSLVTFMVRGILLRTNMVTSGYISRLPIPQIDNGTKGHLADISHDACEAEASDGEIAIVRKSIDAALAKCLRLSDHALETIDHFNRNIQICV